MNIFDWLRRAFEKKPIFSNIIGYSSFVSPLNKKKLYYGIVYSCVDAIATQISTVKYGLYKRNNRGGLDTRVLSHPAFDLLEKPNDFMTGADLFYLYSAHIDMSGISYWYLVKSATNKIVEIWPLQPDMVMVVKGDNFIEGYVYINPKGQRIPFSVDEILEIKRPNPLDIYKGISTIEMARYAQESDFYSLEWNKKFFANGAIPSGILTTPQNIKPEEFQALKDEWHKNIEGYGNAHKTAILQGGLTYNVIAPRQKDMDFLEQRKFNRDEVLSIFKVPKSIVGITDDVNRANAETAEYVFAKRVIEPRLNLLFEKLNRFYLPLFPNSQGLVFDYKSPVPEDNNYELLRKTSAVNKWLTINEVRAEDNYEPIEGGDVLYDSTGNPIGVDTVFNTPSKEKKYSKKSLRRMSKTDRELLIKRNRYLNIKEKEYQSKLKQHYRKLLKDIKKNKKDTVIAKKDLTDLVTQITPDLTNWKKLLVQINIDFGLETMKQAIKDTGETYNIPYEFDLEHSGAIAWLKHEATEAANSVTDTMINRIKEIIARNLSEGETSLNKIKDDVYDTLEEEEDFRIDRITRTELISAYNQGSYQEYKSSGVVENIKWITADDEMVCQECADNDGEVISFDEAFPSGDNQPPAHPNCRCSIVPVFD